jgi:hypothetical protein
MHRLYKIHSIEVRIYNLLRYERTNYSPGIISQALHFSEVLDLDSTASGVSSKRQCLVEDVLNILEEYFDKIDMLHPYKEAHEGSVLTAQDDSQESYGWVPSQNMERDMLVGVSSLWFSLFKDFILTLLGSPPEDTKCFFQHCKRSSGMPPLPNHGAQVHGGSY